MPAAAPPCTASLQAPGTPNNASATQLLFAFRPGDASVPPPQQTIGYQLLRCGRQLFVGHLFLTGL